MASQEFDEDVFYEECATSAGLPFSSNPIWSDIVPIPQDDGQNPVVPIHYEPSFSEAHNYFRAILKRDERSDRAFKLTAYIIQLNPANYTAWYFRRLCIFALNKNLEEELIFAGKVARMHPKNYQLWHHRRVLLDKLNHPWTELKNTADVLTLDAKNYHVWSHRQWFLKRFNLWDGELDFVDALLKADLRNNSAWNQRHLVIENLPQGFSADRISEEISYSTEYMRRAPNNESVWNYVRSFLFKPNFAHFDKIEAMCNQALQLDSTCALAMGVLVDLYALSKQKAKVSQAIELCARLAESVDTIRHNYWNYRRHNLQQQQ